MWDIASVDSQGMRIFRKSVGNGSTLVCLELNEYWGRIVGGKAREKMGPGPVIFEDIERILGKKTEYWNFILSDWTDTGFSAEDLGDVI